MGIGGFILLAAVLGTLAYILWVEGTFRKVDPSDDLFAALPKLSVVMEKAPQAVETQAPPWQRTLSEKLQGSGFRLVGDYSYVARQFFWARVFLAPDSKSALLLVNWVAGIDQGKQVTCNLEIYSFEKGGSFLLTACAQDGAASLLTGANRPTEDQLSLHLKAVFAESSVMPIFQEHQERLAAREAAGSQFRELDPVNVLPSLSKIFS